MNFAEIIREAKEKYGLVQYDDEFTSFLQFVYSSGVNSFIEIGTYKGGTMYCLSKLCEGKKISIDFPNPDFGYDYINENAPCYINPQERNDKLRSEFDDIHFIVADSHVPETVEKLRGILGVNKVDLLFLDGDHTYEGVKKDYEIYKNFVYTGGYIVFHDIKDCEFHRMHKCRVDQLWNELPGNKIEFMSDNPDRGIGVIINHAE